LVVYSIHRFRGVVNPLSPTPVYVQLADLLAAKIESGELRPLDPLPSEKQLQQEHGIARGTARAAVNLLRERGLAFTVPHRGTYVVEKKA
jgi:DNA-binding GntR family transcriptional regulator